LEDKLQMKMRRQQRPGPKKHQKTCKGFGNTQEDKKKDGGSFQF
jgi:hypothetical protein